MEKTYDIDKIKTFLLQHPEYFCDENKVTSINDVLFFKQRNSKNIIFHNECFICDIYSNELWIVKLLEKRVYDKKRKGWLDVKAIEKVCNIRDENGKCIFYRFNGYWKIPEINIK